MFNPDGTKQESLMSKAYSSAFEKIQTLVRPPVWHIDKDDSTFNATQDTVIKAIINPSSPFIALPKNLFKLIADEWKESFIDLKPFCGDYFCLVMSPCS